jgi:hypothetical protein
VARRRRPELQRCILVYRFWASGAVQLKLGDNQSLSAVIDPNL